MPDCSIELTRKLRVLDQTLSMHAILRDRYSRLGLAVDLLLLACAVVFCASAFASDTVLSYVGSPEKVRYMLRAFSILAFMLSIVSLRVDWKGRSGSHRDSAAKMSRALAVFRNTRLSDGNWPA